MQIPNTRFTTRIAFNSTHTHSSHPFSYTLSFYILIFRIPPGNTAVQQQQQHHATYVDRPVWYVFVVAHMQDIRIRAIEMRMRNSTKAFVANFTTIAIATCIDIDTQMTWMHILMMRMKPIMTAYYFKCRFSILSAVFRFMHCNAFLSSRKCKEKKCLFNKPFSSSFFFGVSCPSVHCLSIDFHSAVLNCNNVQLTIDVGKKVHIQTQ